MNNKNNEERYKEGEEAYDKEDYKTAFGIFRELNDMHDHTASRTDMADMYKDGIGVNQNYDMAIKLYQRSIKDGDHEAMNNLGVMYKEGQGVDKNFDKAFELIHEACIMEGETKDKKSTHFDNRLMYFNLGVLYKEGAGVKKNIPEALKWFTKAAEQGSERGQAVLGLMYYNGDDVKQDYKKSIEWSQKAADQGFEEAQHNLGIAYGLGHGVLKDYVKCHMWFNLSASNGRKESITLRDDTEKIMSLSQIEEAQTMARNWSAKKQNIDKE